mgnify:CR=1 FL=1
MVRQSRFTLALVTALVSMGVLSISLYVPSLPAIRAEFAVGPDAVQRTLTFFLVGFAGAQLVIGPLSDRFGRRPVLLGGLIGYMAAGLLCAMAPDILSLTIGRFLQGFAACVGPVVGRAVVRDLFEGPAAGRAFGLIGTALAVVPALAPILGGVIQTRLGWEAAFLTLAAVGLALFAICMRRLDETIRERLPNAMEPARLLTIYGGLIRNRYYVGHAMAGGFVFGGFFGYMTDAPFLFIEELQVPPDLFGFLLVFTVAGYASGSYTSGRLAGVLPGRHIILAGTGIAVAAALMLLAFSEELSLARVIGPMTLYALGFGLTLPASLAGALGPFPRVAGSASALLGFIQMAAAGASSAIVQPLYDGTARSLGLVVLGMSVTALVGYAVLTHGRTPAEADRESAR